MHGRAPYIGFYEEGPRLAMPAGLLLLQTLLHTMHGLRKLRVQLHPRLEVALEAPERLLENIDSSPAPEKRLRRLSSPPLRDERIARVKVWATTRAILETRPACHAASALEAAKLVVAVHVQRHAGGGPCDE